MERHEHFEGVCAVASVGQASGAELAELQEHLAGCPSCQRAYADFLQLAAVRMAAEADQQEEVTGPEAIGYIDSALFRENFLKKAEAEGILSSPEKVHAPMPEPVIRPIQHREHTAFALGAAALILFALGVVATYRGKLYPNPSSQAAKFADATPRLPLQTLPTDKEREALLLRLEAENRRLTAAIASLKASLANEASAVEQSKLIAATLEKDRAALLSAAKERDAKIDDLQHQLSQAQTDVAGVRTQLQQAQASNEATIAADQVRIRELSDQLAEQSAALDREIN